MGTYVTDRRVRLEDLGFEATLRIVGSTCTYEATRTSGVIQAAVEAAPIDDGQPPAGPVGPEGPPGPEGPQGPVGPQGGPGQQGPQGVKGDTGNAGTPGAPGTAGAQGSQGVKGDTGTAGSAGAAGPQGLQGLTGTAGAQGIQGIQGPQGIQGVAGPAPISSRLTVAATSTAVAYATTGLTVPLAAGKVYAIEAHGQYRTAAATTGLGLRLGGTVTATGIRYTTRIWNANAPTQVQAAALSTALLTTAVAAANTDYTWEIRGLIRVNAAGNLLVEFATEVNASLVTIQPDSYLMAQEVA